jgi:putative transposase
MATKDRSDSQPLVNLGGRPSALNAEHIAALHEIVSGHAQASLAEIAGELERRCGVHVCEATIRRALRAEGIVRLKTKRRVYPTADKGPKRWVVERTHAWMERWRRTVMHHDRKLAVSAAWVWLAEASIRFPMDKDTTKHYIKRRAAGWRVGFPDAPFGPT